MTNELLKNSVTNVVPEWQHPVLPGHATQGNILLTTTDFVNPPQSSANFIWMAMEDIIGVANMKIEYDHVTSVFHLYKAKGHLNGDESWDYLWEEVGNWTGLSPEAEEAIKSLMYVGYEFIQEGNGMIVNGIQKDGVKVELIHVNFIDKDYVDQAIETVTNLINQETTRATNREDELEEMIKRARPLSGIATDTTPDGENGTKINVRYNKGLAVDADNRLNVEVNEGLEVDGITNKIDVRYDNDTIKLDSDNKLYSNEVRDNLASSSKYTYSIDKIKSLLTSSMIYMGSVATQADLPNNYTLADRGKVWNVLDTGENFAWTGTEWDPLGGMYVEGNGIKIQDNEISARIDGSKGLGFDSQHRLYTNIDTNKGLQFQSNGKLELKWDPMKGVDIDANDGKLKAKIDTDKGLQFDTTDGSIEIKNGKGIEFDTDGKVQAKLSKGMHFDSNNQIQCCGTRGYDGANPLAVYNQIVNVPALSSTSRTITYTVQDKDFDLRCLYLYANATLYTADGLTPNSAIEKINITTYINDVKYTEDYTNYRQITGTGQDTLSQVEQRRVCTSIPICILRPGDVIKITIDLSIYAAWQVRFWLSILG